MSTNTTSTDGSYGSPKARRLADFLREEAKNGEVYIKGKFIADDVDLSPKEIGALMLQLQGSLPDLEIEKWSYTGATTWRVQSQ
ncbi:hypothetical protein SAMN05192561_102278 [Halopenitus malekzadehii]|uniref:DUF7123 domain-containing protein n=1 Tax=Halopenitus malekzadehii TaxID=1267564 RepID=A0A1H6IMA1_9EURY|nr:hypothetical protein [Halopenitus malekzadehii]SEH47410.1 hypothetical protein SAMN05192561_102278 [Halopenitus malekzadehii]